MKSDYSVFTRNAEQGDQHHGRWRGWEGRRTGESFIMAWFVEAVYSLTTGQPQRAGRSDGADQGHVREEAGDDEEDVHHHRSKPRRAHSLEPRDPWW